MNNIGEKTCRDCLKVFTLPANGTHANGHFICMDCMHKILSVELPDIKRKLGFKRYDE
jgi:hypothetical protein